MFVLFLFSLLLVRVAELQTVSPERYVAFGEQQRVRSIDLPAARGSILDRNGEDLALSVNQTTVYANPQEIADPVAAAAHLAPVLAMDQNELIEKLSDDSEFVYLVRQQPDELGEAVDELAIEGVHLMDEPARFEPSGDLARSVIGTVGVDNTGLSGVEQQYEDALTGTPGELTVERAPDGDTISSGDRHLTPAQQGDSLVLTLDRGMQFEAERVLAEQVDATGALGGIAVVSRVGTGEVLAMANVEATQNDDGSRGPAVPSSNNRAVTAMFEPGSVNKVVTMAAAIEEGVVEPATRFMVPDGLQVADHLFTDHDPHPLVNWSVNDILTQSSNVGTIMVAQELGAERLDEYMRRFGFGQPTALGFPNEAAGITLPLDEWSGTSIGSIPIGQGISVTALQMMSAFNVVANDGVYVPPRLVLARVAEDGARQGIDAPEPHRVISTSTARQLSTMMMSVVDTGTGTSAAIPGYHVAGKTGTARKPQDTGGYEDAAGNYHYVATFAGFVPAEDPELSMIVVLDEPTSSIYGGEVSAPVFAQLGQYALARYGIAPPAQLAPVSLPSAAVDPSQDGLGTPVP
ncbi:MAG: penicillin-binding protein 2 [Acidimicrobiales bacterium]|nr:penicillin-binding protein 2 [Acidimicrobiales bacterium]